MIGVFEDKSFDVKDYMVTLYRHSSAFRAEGGGATMAGSKVQITDIDGGERARVQHWSLTHKLQEIIKGNFDFEPKMFPPPCLQ